MSQTVAACLLSLLEGNFNSITPRDIPEQKITHANPGRREWQAVATLQGMGILISFLSLFFKKRFKLNAGVCALLINKTATVLGFKTTSNACFGRAGMIYQHFVPLINQNPSCPKL